MKEILLRPKLRMRSRNIAMRFARKEEILQSRIITDFLNRNQPQSMTLREDSNGAIDIARKASVNRRNENIHIEYHFIIDAFKSNLT